MGINELLNQFDQHTKQAEANATATASAPAPTSKLATAVTQYHAGAVQHRTAQVNSTPQPAVPGQWGNGQGQGQGQGQHKVASVQGQYLQGSHAALSQIEETLRAAYEAGYSDGQVV